MIIQFNTLTLQFKKEKEVIDLSYQVVFFHGQVSSGKSSIARLINFCLGGGFERTPSLTKELVSAALELNIGEYHVLLERDALNDNAISATCVDKESNAFTVSVPVTGGIRPVWDDKVYNISDLIFYLLNLNVLRIPANRSKEETSLVRLSMRNFMWYCYLDQSKLDNSFFRMEDPQKSRNSREVLKYILQYSTQKLVELEETLQLLRRKRFENLAAAKGLREFLKKFGFSTESEIENFIINTKNKLDKVLEQRKQLESGYKSETHVADQLRNKIREYVNQMNSKEEAIADLERRITEQESLRSELVATKFKLIRSTTIATVFSGVEFENCPSCGTVLKEKENSNSCKLCGSDTTGEKSIEIEQPEVIQNDLSERIKELENSSELHKKALQKAKRQYSSVSKQRRELDEQLQKELSQYESIFLSNIRNVDKNVAALQERMKGLNRLKKMPQEISRLEEEAADVAKRENNLKRSIQEEKAKLTTGEKMIQELEEQFLDTLVKIGTPGVHADDKVVINRKPGM